MKHKKEIEIGLLAIAVLIAAFFTVNYLRGADLFGRDREVNAYFATVDGLVASAPVMIRGYAAGRVDALEYDPQKDSFYVNCSIDRNFPIPADSKMVIYSSNIMGGKAIRIDSGTSGTVIADGAILSSAIEPDVIASLSSGLGDIMGKASKIVDSLEFTISSVNSLLGNDNRTAISSSLRKLEQTVENARNITASLSGKSDQMQKIISNASELSERFEPIADAVDSSLANIEEITRQLAESDLKSAVADVDSAVRQIDCAVGEVSAPLGRLIEQADSLVKAITENPKKYVKISLF